MQSTWLDKLERKFRKFSIPNLMNLILVGMAVVFLSDIFLSVQYGTTLSSYLYFSRSAIFHGEYKEQHHLKIWIQQGKRQKQRKIQIGVAHIARNQAGNNRSNCSAKIKDI